MFDPCERSVVMVMSCCFDVRMRLTYYGRIFSAVQRRAYGTSSKRRLLLLSSSNVYGYEYIQHVASDLQRFLTESEVSRVLLIPYAQLDLDAHHAMVSAALRRLGFHCDSIHVYGGEEGQRRAVQSAEAFFVGGGNTFLLLRALYELRLMGSIRRRVLVNGAPYIGSSAGTNIATVSIATTNDMPIVHPKRYEALDLVPFNINPHYRIEERESGYGAYMGETRDERIIQYLQLPGAPPVLAMREGCMLHVEGNRATLKGNDNAVLFEPGLQPRELAIGTDLSDLCKADVVTAAKEAEENPEEMVEKKIVS